MALELVGHKCKLCGSTWETRKKAKRHVMLRHEDEVYAQHGPGQHVEYIWLEFRTSEEKANGQLLAEGKARS